MGFAEHLKYYVRQTITLFNTSIAIYSRSAYPLIVIQKYDLHSTIIKV